MKKVLLYNPSISTLNIGDEIIFDSIAQELAPILNDAFLVNVSTHLPISLYWAKLLEEIQDKYVCGTNLLRNNLGGLFRQWDINWMNVRKLAPCTLIGVGWQQDGKRLTGYTSSLYKKILNREKYHSVRDNYTKNQLNKLGFTNVINTGCATMWKLTPEFCATIPSKKARSVLYTLTDYNRDVQQDKKVVEILKQEYEKVYLWLQGYDDYEYAKELGIVDKVNIIPPSLQKYDQLLHDEDVDYIGTRLHGGIRALQHKKRTMILAVDGRAIEKKKDFNLPVVKRNELSSDTLRDIIYQERKTDILIPLEEILRWKKLHELI